MGPIITLIKEAYDIIQNPERWTQGYYQRDREGNTCEWRNGYSFCSLGAIHYVQFIRENISEEMKESYHHAVCLLQRISEELFGGKRIQTVNDSSPLSGAHANVLRIYRTALERFATKEPGPEDYYKDLTLHKNCNKNSVKS